MRKLITILSLLFIALTIQAQTKYYGSLSGDNSDGLSEATAWTHLDSINNHIFIAGDSIYLDDSDIFRSELIMPSDGNSGTYIYVGSFGGTATNPRIFGSDISSGWTNEAGNVWKSDDTFANPRGTNPNTDIHFIETDDSISWGTFETYNDLSELDAEYKWTWTANYVYVYAATDPDARYNSVEIPQRRYCIKTANHEYLHFDSLDVAFCTEMGYTDNPNVTDNLDLSGLIIENANIYHIGGITSGQSGYGTGAIYSDYTIQNCNITDCGRRGISLNSNGVSFTGSGVIIQDNILGRGYHTTGVDIGSGSGSFTSGWDGIIIRRNLFYEPTDWQIAIPSNEIFIQVQAGGSVTNVQISVNVFKYTQGSYINIETVDGIDIWNNTFHEVNANITTSQGFGIFINDECTDIDIKNNIGSNTLTAHASQAGALVYTSFQTEAEISSDRNLWYRTNAVADIVQAGTTYDMGDQAALYAAEGWDNPANVTWAAATYVDTPTDLHLDTGSNGIGEGIGVGIELDKDGDAMNSPPDLGAYAYDSSPPIVDPATVTTTAISSTTAITALSGGNVTDIGGASVTGKGVCWSTSSNPTISDSFTVDGTGTGSYVSTITGLSGSTTYHVRSWAYNGVYSYGEDVPFTTGVSNIMKYNNTTLKHNGTIVIIK